MSADFVPFAPAPRGVSSGDTAVRLKLMGAAPAAPAVFQPAADVARPATVTLERDGEVIRRIRLECPCGRMHELSCLY